MKFRRLPQFERDWAALPPAERDLVKQWLRESLLPAVDGYAADPVRFTWPKKLRFESIQGAPGVYAVTWSFSGPDGRATFHFEESDGDRRLVWRRIGHHDIYTTP
ncbi:MAG: hypothetical protein LBR33_02975 [Propionibacteriaceae bacterium]|jgi:hypothetical protein|nr:hypothetical protein [Propionibacteriaceae bacterium]